ncbi:DNA cytosine methyltransferase [Chloroflexota bacterium]
MTHLSLFSGIGGIDIAAEWAGFKTVCFVEIDPYCQKVLAKHWPDVPVIGDIRDVTREKIDSYSEQLTKRTTYREGNNRRRSDCEQGDRNGLGDDIGDICSQRISRNEYNEQPPITLITGGFPCQPVSVAGKRRGKDDNRWLWPQMLRVIEETRPGWIVGENVAGLIRMGIDDCISDLENIGYTCQPYLIPACAVDAPHRRDRVFIVAKSEQSTSRRRGISGDTGDSGWERTSTEPEGIQSRDRKACASNAESCSQDVADTTGERLPDRGRPSLGKSRRTEPELERCSSSREGIQDDTGGYAGKRWWAVEPGLGRVAHGIPHRVDRLRCLGNAVVPQQIYPILKAIADEEQCTKNC